jgi:hypothetical protein
MAKKKKTASKKKKKKGHKTGKKLKTGIKKPSTGKGGPPLNK